VGPAEFLWLAVGTLTEQKDYPTLWCAFAQLVREGLPVRLVVAGEGDQRPHLERLASELGIDDHVRLVGTRSDVPRLLRAADAYVLSSAWEGLPNSLMEAVAAGLPCVATRVGGVEEILTARRTGGLVTPGDPENLARALSDVSRANADQRARLVRHDRTEVAKRFSVASCGDAWERTLDSSLLWSCPSRRRS
jgi:glycosyltransferase involved in cell wall biosynthesis